MFVKYMYADEWEERADHGSAVFGPTWEQVRQAIAALDGRRRTMVSISDSEGGDQYMLVAGQWDGRFLVNTTKDNFDFFSLVDADQPGEQLTLYVGGQDGDYDAQKCVPRAWAEEAARHFYETGDMEPGLNWVSDY